MAGCTRSTRQRSSEKLQNVIIWAGVGDKAGFNLVVSILDILLLGGKELAGLPESGAAVTAEVALCVKLNLQSFQVVNIDGTEGYYCTVPGCDPHGSGRSRQDRLQQV